MPTQKVPMTVLATPTLSPLSAITCLKGGYLPEPFCSSRVRFYYQGRYAIWHALKGLNFSPEANVAFPAFHCGTELDAFIKLGIQVRFYRVDRSLRVDLDSLKSVIDQKTKGVFIIHYFGFPQDMEPIQRLCQENRLRLIEDCAHTLNGRYKDKYLGTFGDVSIFSMRKLLPTADGAALFINDPAIALPDAPFPPPLQDTLRMMKLKMAQNLTTQQGEVGRIIKTSVISPAFALLRKVRHRYWPHNLIQKDLSHFRMERINWGMSKLSKMILKTTDAEWISRQRRENFKFLLMNLKASEHVEPLVKDLSDGVCPLMFPILVKEPKAFVQYLLGCGIQIGGFWQYFHPAFPKEEFPEETFLKQNVLPLPVHQELDRAALKLIVDAVEAWKGSGNTAIKKGESDEMKC